MCSSAVLCRPSPSPTAAPSPSPTPSPTPRTTPSPTLQPTQVPTVFASQYDTALDLKVNLNVTLEQFTAAAQEAYLTGLADEYGIARDRFVISSIGLSAQRRRRSIVMDLRILGPAPGSADPSAEAVVSQIVFDYNAGRQISTLTMVNLVVLSAAPTAAPTEPTDAPTPAPTNEGDTLSPVPPSLVEDPTAEQPSGDGSSAPLVSRTPLTVLSATPALLPLPTPVPTTDAPTRLGDTRSPLPPATSAPTRDGETASPVVASTGAPSLAPTDAPTYAPVEGPVRLNMVSMRLEAYGPTGTAARIRYGRALVPLGWRPAPWANGYILQVRTAPPVAPSVDGENVILRDAEARLGGPLLPNLPETAGFSSMEEALATASPYQLSHTVLDGHVVLDWADVAAEAAFYVVWVRNVLTTEIECVVHDQMHQAAERTSQCARFAADRSAYGLAEPKPKGAIVRGGSVRVSTQPIGLQRLLDAANVTQCAKLHFFVVACNGTDTQPRCDLTAPSNALLLGVHCPADARLAAPEGVALPVSAERLAMADDRVELPHAACVVNTSLFLSAIGCAAAAEWSAWRCVGNQADEECATVGVAQYEWEIDACMHGERVEVRPLGCMDERCSAALPTGTVISFTVAHPAGVRAAVPCLGKPAHEAETAGKVMIGLTGWVVAIIIALAISAHAGKAKAAGFDAHGSLLRMVAAVQFVGLTSDMYAHFLFTNAALHPSLPSLSLLRHSRTAHCRHSEVSTAHHALAPLRTHVQRKRMGRTDRRLRSAA